MTKFLPRREPIEAFGDGGFRFGGMSHRGSLLILPSGMRAWEIGPVLGCNDFDAVLAEKNDIDVLLIGMGATFGRPPAEITAQLVREGVPFDSMGTSAAIHTYNIMLGENRRVAAALIAVGSAHG